MTCKDCIHYEKCIDWCDDFGVQLKGEGCSFFKHAADVVEVVRCKDCAYCHINAYGKASGMGSCRGRIGKIVQLDDFCSYGERKDDAE